MAVGTDLDKELNQGEEDLDLESEVQLSQEERVDGILSVLPIHDAPYTGHHHLKLTRSVGRPRKVERMPTTRDLEYHAIIAKKKVEFVESDPLKVDVERKADSASVLQKIKLEVAREIASIQYQRVEAEKYGRDTASMSSRRIDALERLARIELKMKEMDRETINLGSEKMQKIFMLWVEVMREVATEVLPPETMDLFFNRFATAMDGWEERAANVLR